VDVILAGALHRRTRLIHTVSMIMIEVLPWAFSFCVVWFYCSRFCWPSSFDRRVSILSI
jgi:hypothetical protein